MKTLDDKIVDFCTSVKKGFGTIVDASVKNEFERIHESKLDSDNLGKLLALLERHELLDKKFSVNKGDKFYQFMYKKMNEQKNA
jgi:hypothetical protein